MKKVVVRISEQAVKELRKLPKEMRDAFWVFVNIVEKEGLREVSRSRGYGLENLTGKRMGQKSVRLNRAYRVIFIVVAGEVQIVHVLTVNKHKY